MQLISTFLGTFMFLFLQQFMLLYIKDKMDYFPALGKVIDQLKVGFWDKWGATFVMYLITMAIMFAGIIVPVIVYVIGLGLSGFEFTIGNSILVFILLLIVITVIFVVSNFQTFLQILIHFGEKDGEYTDEIDLIGQNAKEE